MNTVAYGLGTIKYAELRAEISKENPDRHKVMRLTAEVEHYRDIGMEVPEIEDCYVFLNTGKKVEIPCL